MKTAPIALLALIATLAAALPAAAQSSPDKSADVDTTLIAPGGQKLRIRGRLPIADQEGSAERVEAYRDDRVPLGYGFKTLSNWRPGDPRPEPIVEPGRVLTEFWDLRYDKRLLDRVGLAMAEYTDYAYFSVRDNLGWTAPERVKLLAPYDLDEFGRNHELPWWIPGDMFEDGIVIQPIATITSRGIAMESLTALYVEWHLRRRTGDRLPYWFIYGSSSVFGGAGWILKGQAEILAGKYELEIDQATMLRDIEIFRDGDLMLKAVDQPGILEVERCKSRIAFWRAHRIVENIVTREGVAKFKSLIDAMAADAGLDFETAVRRTYGKSVAALVDENSPS